METRVIFHYKTYFFLTYNITIILQNTLFIVFADSQTFLKCLRDDFFLRKYLAYHT